MGIKGLFPYLAEAAPKAHNTSELKRYTGQRLAVDASAWMYQFLTIVRTGAAAENLQNNQGAATSHLQGFVLRTLKLLEAGVHPVFVFDGRPPDMKMAVNAARREVREQAAEDYASAVSSGATGEHVYKAASRSTRVTREHAEHAKEILRAMGMPVVEAPGDSPSGTLCPLFGSGFPSKTTNPKKGVPSLSYGYWASKVRPKLPVRNFALRVKSMRP